MIKTILSSVVGVYIALLVMRLVTWTVVERFFTAHKFNPRAVIVTDLATTFFLVLVTAPIVMKLVAYMDLTMPVPHAIASLPLAARLALYIVLADLAHYWVHRLMHHPHLWRIHKWHHTPTHMSWAAGNRESLLDALMVNSAYAFLWPIVGGLPYWLGAMLLVFNILKNDWMHLNVRLSLPKLEWLFVTPRYHHIHHSANPSHFNSNFSIVFSIWDRLFGTYTRPDVPRDSLEFGIGKRPPLPRLMLGV